MFERNQYIEYTDSVELYEYKDEQGNFDYKKYVETQVSGNLNKLQHIWADEGNIHFLCRWIMKNLPRHERAICHGTRNGAELKYFQKYLDVDIIGTEISPTASFFKNTIQWDFHDVKEEWKGRFDFIYSNSFDHSYNPEYCIKQWMSTLNATGACFIEHSESDFKASQLDPFGASLRAMQKLINNAGNGVFYVAKTLIPVKDEKEKYKGSTWGELPGVVYYVVKHKKN